MHKYDYGITKTCGFLHLRAKLKANKNFHDLIETQKSSLNDKHKLILITCGFPDSIFAEVAAFLISSWYEMLKDIMMSILTPFWTFNKI